ncbi:MAG TPA: IclR family transcriptional regulator [Rhizobiaceae bacterium]|jgi:DNA-binding IclR family transcriptional regulator|nr:IclR family transcriptional regulator [Rhizobiaceae bacterium]
MTRAKTGANVVRAKGIDRAIELLECLHSARQPLRIGEIASRLKAPRSTVYALVKRLLNAAILETYDDDGRVFFGRAVHLYAADFLEVHGLSRRAREEVTSIAERTGETAQFCVLYGNKYTVSDMQTGRKIFKISTEIGVRVPIPWTASGRLLLDHMSQEEVERFVPAEDFVLPDGTRIDPERFYSELRRARHDGYCATTGLVDESTHCIAAPVRNANGVAVACVCVVTAGRLNGERKQSLVRVLQESAARLSSYVTGSTGAVA